jgi:hypothetical protein
MMLGGKRFVQRRQDQPVMSTNSAIEPGQPWLSTGGGNTSLDLDIQGVAIPREVGFNSPP